MTFYAAISMSSQIGSKGKRKKSLIAAMDSVVVDGHRLWPALVIDQAGVFHNEKH